MKKIVILVLVMSFILAGCSGGTNDYSSESQEESYNAGNPYSPGSGHYAGYEWAESKDVSSCGGNSQSFIEGCEEYLRQTGY